MTYGHLIGYIFLLASVAGGESTFYVALGSDSLTQSNASMSVDDREFNTDLDRLEALRGSRDINSLVVFADEIEKKWSGRDESHYGSLMFSIINSFSLTDAERAMQTALSQKYALLTLKRFENIPVEIALLIIPFLQVDVDTDTLQGSVSREEHRKEKVLWWFRGWQRLDREIDKNFDVNDAPRGNISPPTITGLPSGAAPSAIKDPKLRREYESALAKNKEKAQHFNRQYKLIQLNQIFPRQAELYISSAYSRRHVNLEELKQFLETYISDLSARKTILDKVTRKV
jgi:hypothetical protein